MRSENSARVSFLSENAGSLADVEEMLERLVTGLQVDDFPMAEDHSIDCYIEAVRGFVMDSHGYRRNSRPSFDPETPTWDVFALFLQAAIYYN